MKRAYLFLAFVFGISFTAAGIFYLTAGKTDSRLGLTIFGAAYMFIPSLSAVIVKKLIYREEIRRSLLISFKLNRWFLLAWLLMPVIVLCSVGISILFPDVSYNPEMSGMIDRLEGMMTQEQIAEARASLESLPINPLVLILFSGLLAGISINALAGFGEELGWRGFLLREFHGMSFIKASLFIGIIWGLWHAPLILMGHNYPEHPVTGIIMMVILCILITPLLIYVTLKSGSVIAAAIMHGTMNAVAGLSIMLIDGGNDLTVGIAGLAGFITIAIALIGIFIYDFYISREKLMLMIIQQALN